MSKQNGFVLLVTLIMLSMMTLLIIASMRTIFLYGKMQYHLEQNKHDFVRLDKIMRAIIIDNLNNRTCFAADLHESLDQLFSQHVCEKDDGQHRFEYIIYNVERDPCVKIGNFTADLAWLTLRDASKPQLMLHTRIALPTHEKVVCDTNDVRDIQPGFLSWRIS